MKPADAKKWCEQRRTVLIENVREQHKSDGLVLLFGAFENERYRFRQESSFLYFSGSSEPGGVLALGTDGSEIAFTPSYGINRAQWVEDAHDSSFESLGFSDVRQAGEPFRGYQPSYCNFSAHYRAVVELVDHAVKAGKKIYIVLDCGLASGAVQQLVVQFLLKAVPGVHDALVDISKQIARQRMIKDTYEIEQMYRATQITMTAQEAAARMIRPGRQEGEVHGAIAYVFAENGVIEAFPSIVGAGKNSTVLHYDKNNGDIRDNDLVVVDIGADYEGYSSDITRTYPASGQFTPRQKEIYEIVRETQEYIAALAKPGYWLSNPKEPKQSLHHLAKQFLADTGYDRYFVHGLGHYLGLQTHDLGDYTLPLEPGMVITIEPGIYLADEHIGVRIEDDYWIVEDHAVCLSDALPKEATQVEDLVRHTFDSTTD